MTQITDTAEEVDQSEQKDGSLDDEPLSPDEVVRSEPAKYTADVLRQDSDLRQEAVDHFVGFFKDLKRVFIERDDAIELLMRALLLKEHVLFIGPPGTAKTKLYSEFESGVQDVRSFETQFSRFMDDSAVLGPVNPKRLREDGVYEHNTEGMAPEADITRFGEMLDANEPMLRGLLTLMNERMVQRGQQDIVCPLHTAYCDTNHNIDDFLRKHPHAWAMIDRILFIHDIDPLESVEAVQELTYRFQTGWDEALEKSLDWQIVQNLSELVTGQPTMFSDRNLHRVYAEAVVRFREERDEATSMLPQITDRRIAKASQMPEAEAVLEGRIDLKPEDLLAAKYVLATTDKEYDLWEQIVRDEIEAYEERRKQQLDHAQMTALSAVAERLDEISGEIDVVDCDDGDAVRGLSSKLENFKQQVDEVAPDTPEVARRHEEVRNRIVDFRKKLRERVTASMHLD